MSISRSARFVLVTAVALAASAVGAAVPSNAATVPPPPVRAVAVFGTGHDFRLTWVNPAASAFTGVTARYSAGGTAPSAPNRGGAIALPFAKSRYAVLPTLAPNTSYSISIWTHDGAHHYSAAVVTRFTTPAAPEPTGTVGGTVRDTAGHGLLGVRVAAETQSGLVGARTTTTDAAGHYSLTVPAGSYFLGFDGALASGGNSDATGYLGSARQAIITPGDTHADIDASLAPGAAISGTVTDLDGHPLAGIDPSAIPVLPYVQVTGPFLFAIDFGATGAEPSGPDGGYVLKGLPSGPLRVCLDTSTFPVSGGDSDAMGYTGRCATRSVETARGATPSTLNLTLGPNPGGVLTGTVHDAAGRPIAGAFVEAASTEDSANFTSAGGVTRSDGTYRLPIAPGRYQICADASQTAASSRTAPTCVDSSFAVHRGAVTTADVSLIRGALAAGVVRGPTGVPLSGAQVYLETTGPLGGSASFATTDSHGQFRVTGLTPGSYIACYSSDDFTPAQPTGLGERCSRIHYTLRAALTRYGFEARLSPAGAIYGRLSDDLGAALRFAYVDVEPADPDVELDGYSTVELADGRYAVTGLPSGSYLVCAATTDVADLGGGNCYGAPASDPTDGKPVRVTVGHIAAGINVVVPTGGSVAVTATAPQGRPIGGVDVAAVAACAPEDYFCTNLPLFSKDDVAVDASDTTGGNGTVTLTGLGPGTYAICLFAYYGSTYLHDSPTGYADSCGGTTYNVTVTDHQTTTVHRQLDDAGAVAGTITDTHGAPLAGVHVMVSDAATADYLAVDEYDTPYGMDGPIDDTTTDANGHYAIHGVPAGSRTVCVDASGATGGSSHGGYLDGCVLGSDASPKPIPVAAGVTLGNVDLQLLSGAAISGSMKNSTGHAIRDGIAVAIDSAGREIGAAVPGSTGAYRITRLPANTYRVCFLAYRYASQCFNRVPWTDERGPVPAAAAKIAVTRGSARTGINAVLLRS